VVGIRDQAVPVAGNARTSWDLSVDSDLRALIANGFWLDEYTGTDEQKLTAAIADQQAATDRNMPAIILPCRPMSFTTPRQLYSGIKLVGPAEYSGQKNPDILNGARSGPEVTLGGSIGNGASSWWRSPGSDVLDVIMGNFQVQGSQGSATHQFLDFAGGGSMYPCSFHSLSFNFLRSVFGDYASGRKCLLTQADFTGAWTTNNCWRTPYYFGGSDVNIAWSMNNIGVSQSSAQTGDLTRYFLVLSALEATVAGKTYISTMNGWRGVLLEGVANHIEWWGGVVEGFKPTRINGLLGGPGPGSQFKITGGTAKFYGTKIGQGMDNPDGSEDGLVVISAASSGTDDKTTDVAMFGVQFYGANMGTENAIDHNGGALTLYGIGRRLNETTYATANSLSTYANPWSGLPKVSSAASAPTATPAAFTYYNPDFSMQKVA
jgi:hypothetical protein